MPQAKNVESPNSCMVVAIYLDEIPSISSVVSKMPHLPMAKVSPFHVIFDLNGVLIATCFDKGSRIIILCLGLKEFLEKCLSQFQIYI
jgi:hypothetical protein